eukprot:1412803-Prymnesium_polylepis.1
MGIKDIHTKVYKSVQTACRPSDMQGKHVALDIASFKVRAFRSDAPAHFRPSVACKYGYKAVLSRLLSVWAVGLGDPSFLHVVLDGGRFPLKSATHGNRLSGKTYDERIAEALALDKQGQDDKASALYKELAFVACPPSVDAWIIAHCRKYGVTVHVAPCEADSMCGRLALDGDVDAVISYDGDLGAYKGVTHLIVADSGKQGVYWNVFPERDIIGCQVGKLDFRGWTSYDYRTVCAAAGTDYLKRVHNMGWATLVTTLNALSKEHAFGSSELREAFVGKLTEKNSAQAADHQIENYSATLWASFAAFEDP